MGGEGEWVMADPVQMVVVRLLGLDPLQNGLVLVSDSEEVSLSSCLVQTAPQIGRAHV